MATLQILLPDGEQTYELEEDVITIGRVADNTIQIDDASVSSHHARITSLDGKFELKDLNSTNGTRVNGVNKLQAVLDDGALIRFGKIDSVFHSNLPGESIPLPVAGEIEATISDTTQRPADFVNASPFGKRGGKRDLAGTAIFAVGLVAILIALAAIGLAMSIRPPAL